MGRCFRSIVKVRFAMYFLFKWELTLHVHCICLFCQFQGIILVYDITTEDSFKHIAQWLQNIQDVSTRMDSCNSTGPGCSKAS